MIDYFALLDQPRLPWLDSDAIKQAFHEKTLREHPDAQPSGSDAGTADAEFAQLNDAYRTLQDPKLRLQHLLALEGHAPTSRFDSVPAEIADLFPAIASVTHDASRLMEKAASATTALSRSLLQADVVQLRSRIAALLETLTRLHREADAQLARISPDFVQGDTATVATLHQLYVRYSYLGRWIGQLEEHRTSLATM